MSTATTQRPASLVLFEVASEYRQLTDRLRQLDIDDETLADTLEAEGGELAAKLAATVGVALSMEAEAQQIEAHVVKRAYDRIQALNKRAARLRAYVVDTMQACQVDHVTQPDLRFRVRANPPSVIVEPGFAQAQYMRLCEPAEPPVPKPDLKLIGAALKSGTEVPGACLHTAYRLELL